jgi:hypothetical protein
MSICNDRFRCRQLTRTYLCSIIELQAHEGQLSTEMFHVEHYGAVREMFHVEHFGANIRRELVSRAGHAACSMWNTS